MMLHQDDDTQEDEFSCGICGVDIDECWPKPDGEKIQKPSEKMQKWPKRQNQNRRRRNKSQIPKDDDDEPSGGLCDSDSEPGDAEEREEPEEAEDDDGQDFFDMLAKKFPLPELVDKWETEGMSDRLMTAEEYSAMYLEICEDAAEANHIDSSDLVWVKVQSIMDTGAAKSVAPPSLACHLPIAETPESRRGAHFQTAGGGKLVNQGERTVPCWTNVGQAVEMKYSIADVVRPLNAVSQICDRGNEVTFTAEGGYIWNKATNNVVEFPRERGVYVLDTWLQMPRESVKESGFTRQER